jgi:hypothetical protein
MYAKFIELVAKVVKPYTMQDFIRDNDPKDYVDLKRLERLWNSHIRKGFWH